MKKILLLVLALVAVTSVSLAATSNPSPASPGYTPVVLPISGSYTTSTTGLVKFKAPNGYNIVAANATARAVSGTNPTVKVLLKSGAFTNYSGTLSTAGTPKDLTAAANRKIADESTVSLDFVIGGTDTPTWTDLTVLLLLKRL